MLRRRRTSLLFTIPLGLALLASGGWFAAGGTGSVPPGPEVSAGGAKLTVVSINIAKVADVERIAREIESHPLLRDADVHLLQEVVQEGETSFATELASRLKRTCVVAANQEGKTDLGLAILSRYPMENRVVRNLKNVHLILRSRKRILLAATVRTPQGPVRLVNVHLDTRINPSERLEQLEPALREAESFDGPSVMGGDFNTNDLQWISHIVPVPQPGWQAGAVRKLMTQRGFETPFQLRHATFDKLKMQLDWVFGRQIKPLRSAIQPLDFSDHHAIWSEWQILPVESAPSQKIVK